MGDTSEAYSGFGARWQTLHLVFDSSLEPAAWLNCGGPCVALAVYHEGIRGMGGFGDEGCTGLG